MKTSRRRRACAAATVALLGVSAVAGTESTSKKESNLANAPGTMQAVVMRGTGGPEVLSLEDVPIPTPAARRSSSRSDAIRAFRTPPPYNVNDEPISRIRNSTASSRHP
jgi:hypothetical protein